MLELFLTDFTVGSEHGIACNTLKMLANIKTTRAVLGKIRSFTSPCVL
jgi:hypothetical protein